MTKKIKLCQNDKTTHILHFYIVLNQQNKLK